MADRKKITLPVLRNRKKNNKKISWITAYDFATASFAEEAGIDMPAANQIEIHPWHVIPQPLAEYMDKHEILPIAYSTLAPIPNWREGSRWNGKPEDMKSGAMPCEDIANKYGVTVPQLFLKWAIQLGYPVLPKSVKYDRLKENLSLDHIESSIDDMTLVSNIVSNNESQEML